MIEYLGINEIENQLSSGNKSQIKSFTNWSDTNELNLNLKNIKKNKKPEIKLFDNLEITKKQ